MAIITFRSLIFLTFLVNLEAIAQDGPLAIFPKEWKQCQRDRECVFVNEGCCGPTAAISEKFKLKWEHQNKQKCEDITCAAVVDPIVLTNLPRCIQGKCSLGKIGNFQKGNVSECMKLDRPDEQSICFQTIALEKEDWTAPLALEPRIQKLV